MNDRQAPDPMSQWFVFLVGLGLAGFGGYSIFDSWRVGQPFVRVAGLAAEGLLAAVGIGACLLVGGVLCAMALRNLRPPR
jgi:hypothetical protein